MNLETLQYIFYSLGIVVMVLGFLILLTLTISVFYIKRKIDHIHHQVETRFNVLVNETIRPAETAIGVGTIIADTAINAAKTFMRKKKKS